MAGTSGQVRIGLTISGAISLGAYEGGVLAALLAAEQAVNEQDPHALRVDAMAGASAGSITALLAARTLSVGLDPIEVMYRAWVKTPQLQQLADKLESPLSVQRTREDAEDLLNATPNPKRAQKTAIKLNMALGCLRGLTYEIGRLAGPPFRASTYLDWAEWDIDGAWDAECYTTSGALDAALASGAHAAAFPPYGLDRSDPEVQKRYADNKIIDFPPSKYLWYTDGGTIDNEPLGRALDLTNVIDVADPIGDARRLHLMITPDPARPPTGNDAWSTREPSPEWTRTGLRTLKLLRSQRLYDDLRRLEKTNSRIRWIRLLEDRLLSIMSDPPPDAAAELDDVRAQIAAQRAQLMSPTGVPRPPESTPDSPLAVALRSALDAATGVANKHDVEVSVISPLLLLEAGDDKTSPKDLLAGDFLGHFGGFLAERLRENDFDLGFRCMLRWLKEEQGLLDLGLDPSLNAIAVAGAQEAYDGVKPPWVTGLGGIGFSDLPFREKLQLYRAAIRSAVIAYKQVRSGAF